VNEPFIAAVRRDVADGYPKPVDLEAATKSVTDCSYRLFRTFISLDMRHDT